MGDPRKALRNLEKHMINDILATTDEEIEAEIIEDGGNPQEIAQQFREWMAGVIERHKSSSS